MVCFVMPKQRYYEVDKLIDKRKTPSRRLEYRVRWKGYSRKYDTWEPVSNLSSCLDLVQEFDAENKEIGTPTTSRRPSRESSSEARKYTTRSHISAARPKRVIQNPRKTVPSIPLAIEREKSTEQNRGNSKASATTTRRSGLRDRETLLPRQTRLLRSLRQRRGRSSSPALGRRYSRPRDVQVRLTPMSVRALNGFTTSQSCNFRHINGVYTTPPYADHEYCNSPFQEFSPTWRQEGSTQRVTKESDVIIVSPQRPATKYTNKLTLTLKQPTVKLEALEVLDRKLRLRESLLKNKHTHLLKRGQCTEVVLTHSAGKNSLTPEALDELTQILDSISSDSTSIVLLSSVGDFFCTGIDLSRLLSDLESEKYGKDAAKKYAVAVRNFVNCLIDFPKPIVALVQGPATGLGCAMLPHFDTVYCSERAYFALPYTDIGQTPEACSSYLFPKILGHSLANDMLLNGSTLTAQEAKSAGLVSGVYLHDSLVENVLPLLKHMATKSQEALMTTKELIRNPERSRLKHVNQCEFVSLKQRWENPRTVACIKKYLSQLEQK